MSTKGLIIVSLVIGIALLSACSTTPGPVTTPGPSSTPGPTETPGPSSTPGPTETPGPGDRDMIEIKGSGNIISRQVDVEDFNEVKVSGKGILLIEQGVIEGLVVETDENLMEYVKVSVSNRKLQIENVVDDGYELVPTDNIYYHLKVKEITDLALPGVVTVKCDNLQTDSLFLDVSGVNNIELSGDTNILTISADGVGNFNGEELKTMECNIHGTGNVDLTVSVVEKLDVGFKGIGKVNYIGNPEVTGNPGMLVDVKRID
ncbi:MAG: DUF2807 domain-containing protein [Dehalococcoidales bacterium]|nr:MAG: DUF2807 domain-containing protein [Dehalococcoidales bacterium]